MVSMCLTAFQQQRRREGRSFFDGPERHSKRVPRAMRSLTETIADLRQGRTTSLALAEAAIERHRQYDAALNAYRTFDAARARDAARRADAAFAAGHDLGPLQGIPVSVKDLFGVAGWPIYAGTARRLPAQWEAGGPL